eukprot:TRINITY_DN25054_c0_g3_i1.p1 TRINITY_DN25054_c0_g3~~TRINITY_DN25054_c0_g3_i1.p1  ORF type:complete len:753 (-),score=51.21 TRINITY_DN25054_c0_g3_i1:154-2412(-)
MPSSTQGLFLCASLVSLVAPTEVVRLLSVDSVFECIFASPPHATFLANCSQARSDEQGWELDLDGFMSGDDIRVRLTSTPQLCLGVQGAALSLVDCDISEAVLWRWSNGSFGTGPEGRGARVAFALQHKDSSACLARAVSSGVSTLRLENCPSIDWELTKGFTQTDYQWEDVYEKVFEKTERRFLWLPAARPQLIPDSELPLRVVGGNMVGQSGHIVRLRGVNWYGAHMPQLVNNGLEILSVAQMCQVILNLGFNHVRIGYSTEMLIKNPEVDQRLIAANPALAGLRSMDIFDQNVEALTEAGLLVIINNHVTENKWCCEIDDGNSLWFGDDWSENIWFDSLTNISRRYRNNRKVVGVDIRNEVRPDLTHKYRWLVPWWGKLFGMEYITANWRKAAQEGSKALWRGNPDSLVFVEGNMALDLSSVTKDRMIFGQDCLHSRVVYSVHDYEWYDRWFRIVMAVDSANKLSIREQFRWLWKLITTAPMSSAAEFSYERDYAWGYLKRENFAPVWIGEFGGYNSNAWWRRLAEYIVTLDLDFCYWGVNGYKWPRHHGKPWSDRTMDQLDPDWYGLLTKNFTQVRAPWKVFEMTPMLSRAGVQQAQVGHPGVCVFRSELNIVESSGADLTLTFQQTIVTFLSLLLFSCAAACIFAWSCCRWRHGSRDSSLDAPALLTDSSSGEHPPPAKADEMHHGNYGRVPHNTHLRVGTESTSSEDTEEELIGSLSGFSKWVCCIMCGGWLFALFWWDLHGYFFS